MGQIRFRAPGLDIEWDGLELGWRVERGELLYSDGVGDEGSG